MRQCVILMMLVTMGTFLTSCGDSVSDQPAEQTVTETPTETEPVAKVNITPEQKAAIETPAPIENAPVTLVTLDPGHFHAALVQKSMYPQINSTVYVYAPTGDDVKDHLKRIDGFNSRDKKPTAWKEVTYTGTDYLAKALDEKKGNVVMLSGNNGKKTEYIKASVDAGLNVFSDKPMCINKEGYELLLNAFDAAEKNDVLLYDIMTERYEITTILQKELAHTPAIFGELKKGSVEDPSIVKESVHHFFKYVSGNPLKRPAWFFDTTQQGEGIVDVTTHLVDLVMWEAYPEQAIAIKDIDIVGAKRWPTLFTKEQFNKVTHLNDFPDYLKKDLNGEGSLPCYANGEIDFTVKGIHANVKVMWNYQAPEGAKDTHYSIMKGTKANVIIRQGKEQNYQTELYVEPVGDMTLDKLGSELYKFSMGLMRKYPGVRALKKGNSWHIAIPNRFRVGHEAHFAQVTEKYLKYLEDGKLPEWEMDNMKTKYYITTSALEKAK